MTTDPAMEILDRLEARHPRKQWLTFRELREGPGFARKAIDFAALHQWESGRHRRFICVEVKVSPSDWHRELDQPGKSARWREMAHQYWLAAPAGIIPVKELPAGWGLLETFGEKLRARRHAALNPAATGPSQDTWVMMLRNVAERETRIQEHLRQFAEFSGKPISLDQLVKLAHMLFAHRIEDRVRVGVQEELKKRRDERKVFADWSLVAREWKHWIEDVLGWTSAPLASPDKARQVMSMLTRCVGLLRTIAEQVPEDLVRTRMPPCQEEGSPHAVSSVAVS